MKKTFLKDSPLTTTSDMWSMVLHDNELNLFKSGRNILNKFQCSIDFNPVYFACCYHDKDTCEDDETRLESPHYQCVIVFAHKYQKKTLLKVICDLFHCNDNQIGLDKVVDICEMSRYILHIGYPLKYQYKDYELTCNDIETFNTYKNLIKIRDQLDCVSVVERFNYNLRDIVLHVSNYSKYRSVIKDLIYDSRQRGRY